MNARTLTTVEKHQNAFNRRRRENARLAAGRRLKSLAPLLMTLRNLPQLVASLTPDDSLLLAVGDLNAIKAAVPRLLRFAYGVQAPCSPPSRPSPMIPSPARPRRKARRGDALPIQPWIVKDRKVSTRISVQAGLVEAAQSYQQGATATELLDQFQAATALPWSVARDLLATHGRLQAAVADDLVQEMIRAREFWMAWRNARENYKAAVALGQIQAAPGDWGLVEAPSVPRLLPEFSLPREEFRGEYLIRLVIVGGGQIELSFFSKTYRPAFWITLGYPPEKLRRRRQGAASVASADSANGR